MPEPHWKSHLNHCVNIYHRCSNKRCEAQAQKRPKKWQCWATVEAKTKPPHSTRLRRRRHEAATTTTTLNTLQQSFWLCSLLFLFLLLLLSSSSLEVLLPLAADLIGNLSCKNLLPQWGQQRGGKAREIERVWERECVRAGGSCVCL